MYTHFDLIDLEQWRLVCGGVCWPLLVRSEAVLGELAGEGVRHGARGSCPRASLPAPE